MEVGPVGALVEPMVKADEVVGSQLSACFVPERLLSWTAELVESIGRQM